MAHQEGEEFLDFSRRDSLASARHFQEPEIAFPLPIVRNKYETDDICTICECKFNVQSLAHTKKLFCRFCYRGACARCLSFEYFHTETRSIEYMCPNCHHKLKLMSQNFSNELKMFRLERVQLKQEINLATRVKEQFADDRKIAEAKLAEMKKHAGLSGNEQAELLEKRRKIHENLVDKIRKLRENDEELKMQEEMLVEDHKNLKASFESMKKQIEKENAKANRIRDELNQIEIKRKDLMKQKDSEVSAEDHTAERVEVLNEEIYWYREKLQEKISLNEELEMEFRRIEGKITENNENIADLHAKLSDSRRESMGDSERFSQDEEKRLIELQNTMENQDNIILSLEGRLKIIKETKTKNPSELYSKRQEYEVYDNKSKNNDSAEGSCCVKCDIL